MHNQNVVRFVQAVIECSLYISPTEPGLTYDEIIEAGKRAGFEAGEIGDALSQSTVQYVGGNAKLLPNEAGRTLLGMFSMPQDPDFRNLKAFDFVHAQLAACVRADGARNAKLEHSVIVERALAYGIPRNDIEAAITIDVLCGHFIEKDGVLRFADGHEQWPTPTQQRNQSPPFSKATRNETRTSAYPIVKDIIERRTDGRPTHAESLDAFTEALERLGYRPFRLWWVQTVAELRRGDVQSSPVSVLVLAAALVEGALTFVVKHARSLQMGVFRSSDFDGNPRAWKIDSLVNSAASGGEAAILDRATHQRAESLVRARQRIHAGRMLSEFPGGVPDLRPEEARDAKATAELVVRRVLDWLRRYPPAG